MKPVLIVLATLFILSLVILFVIFNVSTGKSESVPEGGALDEAMAQVESDSTVYPGPRARALFTPEELATLTEWEMNEDPINLKPRFVPRPREKTWTEPNLISTDPPYARYALQGQAIAPDTDVAPPLFLIPAVPGDVINDLNPTVQVLPPDLDPGQIANIYYEFDVVPTFDSPNFWRWPTLNDLKSPDDLTGRDGLTFELLRTWQRNIDPTATSCTFPFRASAMRLPPDWAALDYNEMERQAAALAYALPIDQLPGEVFRYVRQTYNHASDTVTLNAIDIFTRGMGECGHVNNFTGTLLEMNGIRYRGVSGSSLKARAAIGRSGHSAIEIQFPGTNQWSYVDPYYDFYFPDVAASEFTQWPEARNALIDIYPRDLWDEHGSGYTMSDLFAYRKYFDFHRRLGFINMFQAQTLDADFGTSWQLEVATSGFDVNDLFPERQRVYVRARFLITDGPTVCYVKTLFSDEQRRERLSASYRLSPWTHTYFDLPLRRLIMEADRELKSMLP